MALTERIRRNEVVGNATPRIAPPVPVGRSLLTDYEAAAKSLNLTLQPWQRTAARYITALSKKPARRPRKDEPDEKWLYPEIAIVVARQNGKTTLLLPRIKMGLVRGEAILHTAQNRILPRETFRRIASAILMDPELGPDAVVRKANGQEEIRLLNGGRYKLVAPTADSARGESADLVLIDEVREQRDQDLMDAMLPTITAKANAQIIYCSNAGDEDSVVLNELKRRGEEADPNLAYLEWSADPTRSLDDEDGWAEANPMLGYGLDIDVLRRFRTTRPAASFETEHLCRWVQTMLPGFLPAELWERQHAGRGTTPRLEAPNRAMMGVALDASGKRGSVCLAWMQTDGTIALRLTDDITADTTIDVDKLGKDLRQAKVRVHARDVGYDPETEGELAKYLSGAKPVIGRAFTSACLSFVQAAQAGRLRWEDETGALSSDLAWTARKIDADDGTFAAVKARQDRPITAMLAAIRAVSLATGNRMAGVGVF